ncbi:hypothetical protein EMCRGX_G034184 [Ephydatia muelleri]|eukprot:Em0023g87a
MAAASLLNNTRLIFKHLLDSHCFDRVLKNLEVVAASRGACTCELEVTEDHLNRAGALHGGFTATLVDSVSTVAILTADKPPGVSVDLSVTYLSPARAGDTLVVTAECLKLGRSIVFASVDIRNKKDGVLVAQGRQTKHLGPQKQPSN